MSAKLAAEGWLVKWQQKNEKAPEFPGPCGAGLIYFGNSPQVAGLKVPYVMYIPTTIG